MCTTNYCRWCLFHWRNRKQSPIDSVQITCMNGHTRTPVLFCKRFFENAPDYQSDLSSNIAAARARNFISAPSSLHSSTSNPHTSKPACLPSFLISFMRTPLSPRPQKRDPCDPFQETVRLRLTDSDRIINQKTVHRGPRQSQRGTASWEQIFDK